MNQTTRKDDEKIGIPYCDTPRRDAYQMRESLLAALEREVVLRSRVEEMAEALRPFAKFACDPPCECYNCRACAALAAYEKEGK